MSYTSNAVVFGIVKNEKRVGKILDIMSGSRKGDVYATIRNMIVGEAAAQKTRLTEAEIKNAVYAVYRHCKKGKDER